MRRTLVIGVTGGFGTGKSTVARMFARLGAYVIDADKIAHRAILPGAPSYKKVISLFGTSILSANKRIDRKRLAELVFNDKKRLLLLNRAVHPEVIKRIRGMIKKSSKRICIIDAPLLVEAGLLDMIDRLIVVTTDKKTQLKRCMSSGLKRRCIKKRIRSQLALSQKRRLADFIIDNNRSFNSTRKKVREIWEEIKDGTRKHKA